MGALRAAMRLAMVKVLPLPVTPRRVCSRMPFSRPVSNLLIAVGWSPVGWYLLLSLKSIVQSYNILTKKAICDIMEG